MRVPPDVNAPHRLELMMTLPEGWKPSSDLTDEHSHWPTRLLQSLSRLPREREGWLGWGHTVPNGDPPQPLAPHTALCGVIIAPSLLVPVAFYELNIDGERVAFYSAIPLYREELELQRARRHGSAARTAAAQRHQRRRLPETQERREEEAVRTVLKSSECARLCARPARPAAQPPLPD